MPIRASERHRYPKNWPEIRRRILERAGNRCEWCSIENGAVSRRRPDGTFERFDGMEIEMAAIEGVRLMRIVLPIAHLDHTPENCAPENLRALCQRCHLRHDAAKHAANSRETRRARKDAERPLLTILGS